MALLIEFVITKFPIPRPGPDVCLSFHKGSEPMRGGDAAWLPRFVIAIIREPCFHHRFGGSSTMTFLDGLHQRQRA